MSFETAASSQEILDAFTKATTTFNLCPNRVWSVARHDLPRLLPAAKDIQPVDDHSQCTVDFCVYSQRDFTAVEQRHECTHGQCELLPFSQDELKAAATAGRSTVWALDGTHLLKPPLPYMAISHVWSDGTGSGAWPDGEVNQCLYDFFAAIAKRYRCQGIWWDTISIPRAKAERALAIRNIQRNFQDARMTLVHDCFLRNSRWVGAEAACFAILMSPWFSRGWTALELANSRKVKVLFKGPDGLLVKDLDEEILAKDTDASEPHRRATALIKSLRRGVMTLDDLLVVLGARYTSWPKDMAVISGLLIGVDIAPHGQSRDTLGQDIYRRILQKIGRLSAEHLFHNSATILKGYSWLPINLFSMPISKKNPSLKVEGELNLVGTWDILPMDERLEQDCVWNGIHPLLKMQLQLAARDVDGSVLLTECGTQAVDRALLVKLKDKRGVEGSLCCRYVGALYFRSKLPKYEHIRSKVTILGDGDSCMANDVRNAGEFVKAAHDYSSTSKEKEFQEILNGRIRHMKQGEQRADREIKSLWPVENFCVREISTGRTALHYAIWRGDHVSAKELIKISDITLVDNLGQSPLHLAAERGDEKVVIRLLNELANMCDGSRHRMASYLDTKCDENQTGLHRAALGCSRPVVTLLLKAGADPNLKDKDGNTAVHIAIRNRHGTVARQLLSDSRCDVEAADFQLLTPLCYATKEGYEEMISLLVEKGANVNLRTPEGKFLPLQLATLKGNYSIMELLIASGADVNGVADTTALHVATSRGDETAVRLLIRRGADPTVRDRGNFTPICYAPNINISHILEDALHIHESSGWIWEGDLRAKGHSGSSQIRDSWLRLTKTAIDEEADSARTEKTMETVFGHPPVGLETF